MSVTPLRGIVPPVVTPLLSNGDIDVPSLERLTDHLIDSGVHGLFALGSSGEVAYLDEHQRALVLETVVRATRGRVPVLAGAIDLTARRVFSHVDAALAAGADAIVVTAPIYAINDSAEIERHFRAIAKHSKLPVWAYDIPARVKTKLDSTMLLRLAADRAIVGVKDSSGDDVAFRRLVAANRVAGSPLSIFTGHEVVVDGMLLLGADGAVPGLANVDAAGYVRLWEFAQLGEWDRVAAEQDRLAGLFDIVAQAEGRSGDASGVGAFKVAMQRQGIIDGTSMAYPVEALDGEVAERIAQLVRNAGLATTGEASAVVAGA